jgi:hypothetical protein
VVIDIEPVPPEVLQVYAPPDKAINASHPAKQGELLSLLVSVLGNPGESLPRELVKIIVGGLEHSAHQVVGIADRPASTKFVFLGSNVPIGGAIELKVVVVARLPVKIPVAPK